MNPNCDDWDFEHRYGLATWTDLMRSQECRLRIAASRDRLRTLAAQGARPIEIVQEKLALDATQQELRQLEWKFQLKSDFY